MTQTEIKAVEVVRQIRDQHYALLKDKSREDIKHFFTGKLQQPMQRLSSSYRKNSLP